MNIRRDIFVLLGALPLLIAWSGQPLSAAPATETLACVHWLGLNQIELDPNPAQFMKMWQLPQTAVLVKPTLDKLSRWPGGGVSNAAAALIRPLLDDLVTSEFYLEVSTPTNPQPQSATKQSEGRSILKPK